MTPQRRYPFRPLKPSQDSIWLLAQTIGVSPRTIYRWQQDGLTQTQADKAACALGLHPALIWPEWLEA